MRLLKLIQGDIRFQFKYGFYFIYALFSVLYILLLYVVPEQWKGVVGNILIYSDPAALGLFFIGAIMLFERSERVLNALVVSPVTVHEYMLSKIISLEVISILVSLFLGVFARSENLVLMITSVILASAIFTLLGLMIATKVNSLNQNLMITSALEIFCFVPPIAILFYPLDFLYWYPLNHSMLLLSNTSTMPVVSVLLLVLTIILLYFIAYKMVTRMWKNVGGIKL